MRKSLFLIIVLAVLSIGVLHALTPGHEHFFHDTYRRLGYFPIAIGALLFGLRGGIFFSILTCLAFIPHLLIYKHGIRAGYISELTEIVLYLSAGAVIGMIAEKEKRLREGYRILSEKLEKSYDKLRRETSLLIDVEEQLRSTQKFAALGKLAASLAHEIKNPLASIRGATEIILEDYSTDNPRRKFPEIIMKETLRLDKTVDEALRFARPPKLGEKSPFKPLAQVMEHIKLLNETRLSKKNIRCDVLLESGAGDFPVDADKLTQVIINLVLNAEDALEKGGMVRIRADRDGHGLIVFVEDDGPGIHPEIKGRLFEPFSTVKTEGSGLGLAISRKIVESYRGTLDLCDEPREKGACFKIVLPEKRFEPEYSMGVE
ncbi:MAG: hypothetical protein KKD44_09210 [Proteobacteria bacterium]|nr:hypothetical protein [Pseudomonadota bacterium]